MQNAKYIIVGVMRVRYLQILFDFILFFGAKHSKDELMLGPSGLFFVVNVAGFVLLLALFC